MLHHKIAKPGERLRYSVVGADRENIIRRTYTVGMFLPARGDGDATLSTRSSSTQKTLLLLHDVRENDRKIRDAKRQAFAAALNFVIIDSNETSRISRLNIDETCLVCGRYLMRSENETKFKLNAVTCRVD